MKLLVIEDEHKIAQSIKKGLEEELFTVDLAFDGQDGYDMASSETYDAIILDVMLPGMDGITVCSELRKHKVHTPILMLTAKSAVNDKVVGLNTGADDYLSKPFSFDELLARIRAIMRRPKQEENEVLSVDTLTLNTKTFEVTRDGKSVTLSKREYSLLEYLLRHKNTIVTKDQIIKRVWEYDTDVLANTVEVYIGYLRKKIDGSTQGKSLIHTVRGFGYKLGV